MESATIVAMRAQEDLLHLCVLALQSLRDDRPEQPEPIVSAIVAAPPPPPPPVAAATPRSGPTTSAPPAQLLEQLREKKAKVRNRAAKELARFGEAAARPLAELLKDPVARTRIAAAGALARLGPEAAPVLDALGAALADPSEDVVAAVVEALLPFESAAVAPLGEAMRSADPERRSWLVRLAPDLGAAGEPLVALALTDPSEEVRQAAHDSIGGFPGAQRYLGTHVAALRAPESAVRDSACRAIARLGSEASAALPEVLRLLEDEDWEVRLAAVGTIGRIGRGDPGVAERLAALLSDDRIEEDVLEAIGALGETSYPLLARFESDPDPDRRIQAIQIAARFPDEMEEVGTERILAIARDPAPEVRRAAIDALSSLSGRTESPRLVQAFACALADADSGVRKDASFAISYVDAEPAEVAALVLAELPRAGEEARQTIQGVLAEKAEGAAGPLLESLGSGDAGVRIAAALALWEADVDPSDRVDALARLARQAGSVEERRAASFALGRCRREAEKAVAALGDALRSRDSGTAQAAASSLGLLAAGVPAAQASLLEALRDPNDLLRAAAVESIGRFSAEAGLLPAGLTDALGDPSPLVRSAAAVSIGELGERGKEAEEALARLESDPAEEVRRAVAWALQTLRKPPKKKARKRGS